MKKHECQGKSLNIVLHYDIELDLCEAPDKVQCKYSHGEEEALLQEIRTVRQKGKSKFLIKNEGGPGRSSIPIP